LSGLASFSFATQTTHSDPKQARLLGMAFSLRPHSGYYVPLAPETPEVQTVLEEFRSVLDSEFIEKVGHNLKFHLSVLKWHGLSVQGRLFDTMVAHSLMEPDMRHPLSFLCEAFLGYTTIPLTALMGNEKSPQASITEAPVQKIAEYTTENAD